MYWHYLAGNWSNLRLGQLSSWQRTRHTTTWNMPLMICLTASYHSNIKDRNYRICDWQRINYSDLYREFCPLNTLNTKLWPDGFQELQPQVWYWPDHRLNWLVFLFELGSAEILYSKSPLRLHLAATIVLSTQVLIKPKNGPEL